MREVFVAEEVHSTALRPLNYIGAPRGRAKRGRVQVARLGKLVSTLGAGYKHIFTNIDVHPGHGLEVISQSDMFAAEPSGRHIRPDCIAKPEAHRIKPWQLLIAGAGTLGETELYGRAIIADDRLTDKYLAYHALDLTFEDAGSDMNLYLYAYLLTGAGLRAVRSTSYGTKILSLRRDLMADLPVPIANDETQARVAALVRLCVEQRGTYLRELQTARRAIEDLPEMRDAYAMCSERRARMVLWDGPIRTFGAWNYASAGEALSLLQKRWPSRMRDVLTPDGVFNGPRFARVDCAPPHGIDFLSQRDVFLMRPVARRISRPPISDRMLFVPKEAVLAGSHGQITDGGIFGKVELASFAACRCGVTQDILRLLFLPAFRAVAYAFLSTTVGQRLLKSTAVGTSIPSMRLDLLMDIPIPHLSRAQQHRVDTALGAAERARTAADTAEAEAIRIIEEEVLPAWLA